MVATVNAVNFVDGLDGLAAGVVGISAVAFFVFCYGLTVLNDASRATTGALLSAALAGACAGFLVHNFHPARIFMGDSGSMLIGLVLSATAITVTTQFAQEDLAQGAEGGRASLLPIFLPLSLPILILIVPLVDLLLAVVRRTRAGRSPFAPDKQHLHHRLLEIGHSHRRAVLIMWLWAGLIAFGTVLASLYTGPSVWIAIGLMAAVTLTLTFVLPVLHRPRALGRRTTETRTRFPPLQDFVLTFTSTRSPSTKWPPDDDDLPQPTPPRDRYERRCPTVRGYLFAVVVSRRRGGRSGPRFRAPPASTSPRSQLKATRVNG